MLITIAICTFNRADLLDKTLNQISGAYPPRNGGWEVIVVNNRCTDNTDEIIAKYSGILPIRRVYQDIQGLSNARNAAIDNALGEYIIWTDDDVLVDKNWLNSYEDAFERWPDASIFGGPILPWFEVEPPEWLIQNWESLAACYATRDLGDSFVRLDQDNVRHLPFGANYCTRRAEKIRFRYDPLLGRNPKKTVLGEETVVMNAMFDSGSHGWWIPNARVQHWIPEKRMNFDYLRDYFRGLGRMMAILETDNKVVRLFSVPRWLWRVYVNRALRYYWSKLFFSKTKIIGYLRDYELISGQISEERLKK